MKILLYKDILKDNLIDGLNNLNIYYNLDITVCEDINNFKDIIKSDNYDLIIFDPELDSNDPFEVLYIIEQLSDSSYRIVNVDEFNIDNNVLIDLINKNIDGLYYTNSVDIRKLLDKVVYLYNKSLKYK